MPLNNKVQDVVSASTTVAEKFTTPSSSDVGVRLDGAVGTTQSIVILVEVAFPNIVLAPLSLMAVIFRI